MHVIAVIPARMGSTRLAAKPLADIHGKPMVQWVYERARAASSIHRTVVATDHPKIVEAVQKFGGEAILTDPALPSGTDRVAAVADLIPGDVFVNIQGDEPFMDARAIDGAVKLVVSGKFSMATAMTPLRSQEELYDQGCVKVIADAQGRAIYFSRFAIPYSRGEVPKSGFVSRRHVGLYVYARETLMTFRSLAPSQIEKGEVLEQLRALENGIAIGITEVDFVSVGVDTAEDLERARRLAIKS
ncbi:3-deoxy-manno-octulosonate cytidylyltransferase [Bdellovibrionota bacterium FG-2]